MPQPCTRVACTTQRGVLRLAGSSRRQTGTESPPAARCRIGSTRNSARRPQAGAGAASRAAWPGGSWGAGRGEAVPGRRRRRPRGMELLEIDLEGGNSWEPAAGAGSPGPQRQGARGRGGSSADSLAEEEEEEEEDPAGRYRSTSSLVSGLLTELYSCGGRARHRDSVDSSTEASAGSDIFPGGRGSSAESRFLQELQQRPSQRHQIEYLGQKDADELATIVRELNYRICVQSAKLLRHLKQKDRLLHKVQKNCDIVTACLQAVSQKRP